MERFVIEIDQDLEDIVPSFLENRKSDITNLLNYIQDINFQELERIGHKVSGSSGGYGFHKLGEIAKDIELKAQEKSLSEIRELVKDFQAYVENLDVKYIKVD